jgi:epoxyqueuosine reductase
MSLKDAIKAEANQLGFVLFGVAPSASPPHYPAYQAWIRAGRQAGMAYLARPEALTSRSTPEQLLPGCRSILCVGLPYPPPLPPPAAEPDKARGRIAAYATLPDYHNILASKLEALAARLPSLTGKNVHWRTCVDTAPILEKDYAFLAGLGWIGRNSLLLTPKFGSYVFLGELLTDLEMEPDEPLQGDPCAQCYQCVQACPTRALLPERSVDARRCLSYWTIEHRGPIPEPLRPLLGERIFGCDSCQVACPLNAQPSPAAFTYAQDAVIEAYPDLLEAFNLSQEAWEAKYGQTPVSRPKYAGFRRNVAYALGNAHVLQAEPALQQACEQDPDPVVREACAWALEQLRRD